jgi:hypothetical protein
MLSCKVDAFTGEQVSEYKTKEVTTNMFLSCIVVCIVSLCTISRCGFIYTTISDNLTSRYMGNNLYRVCFTGDINMEDVDIVEPLPANITVTMQDWYSHSQDAPIVFNKNILLTGDYECDICVNMSTPGIYEIRLNMLTLSGWVGIDATFLLRNRRGGIYFERYVVSRTQNGICNNAAYTHEDCDRSILGDSGIIGLMNNLLYILTYCISYICPSKSMCIML